MLHQLIDSFAGDYGFLSNFFPCLVGHAGNKYPTAEHAFQCAKTVVPEERYRIANAITPGIAKRLGGPKPRGIATLRPDWEAIKVPVMTEILRDKFTRHIRLREELLLTQSAMLIEGNTWCDNIWGDCRCAKCRRIPGENLLGRILMRLREELKNGPAS